MPRAEPPRVVVRLPRGYHGRWDPLPGEIAAAAAGLMVGGTIVVRPTHAFRGRLAGHYVWDFDPAHLGGRQKCHVVTANADDSAAEASQTLWHELTHAAQKEREMALGSRAGGAAERLRRRLAERPPGKRGRWHEADEVVARDNEGRRGRNRTLAAPRAEDPGAEGRRAEAHLRRYRREAERAEAKWLELHRTRPGSLAAYRAAAECDNAAGRLRRLEDGDSA